MATEATSNSTLTVDIVCGTLRAKLLTRDLSCGSSRCIEFGSRTLTPFEFQREAGKASAKNWKNTIRYQDQPLSRNLDSFVDCSGKRCCRFIGVPYPPSVQLQAGANSQPNFPPSTASALADTTQASVPADLNNAIDIKSTDVSSLPISISDNIDSSTQDQRCSLPDFEPSSIPVFNWGSVDSDTFCHSLEASCSEVVHWRNNSFKIPSGNVGKKFVLELARLFRSAGEGSSLESIALKAAFTFCTLVTQKPTRTSNSKDHVSCLERRMLLWSDGNLNELILEGRAIQNRLKTSNRASSNNSLSQSFAKLMFSGKTAAAMQLLASEPGRGGVLRLDDTIPGSGKVYDILKSKHPAAAPLHYEALLPDSVTTNPVHPVIFDALDGPAIKAAALRTSGAAGPSGIDAHSWRRLCSSFRSASDELCSSIALLARRLCTMFVDPVMISPLMVCRLIALDKRPGVRPIGIGETVRRIIAEAVLCVIGEDVQFAAGSLQLCAGQPSGGEAAVHAMREAFNDDDTEGMLLIDATNAFNSLNRAVALYNIQRLCASFSTILINVTGFHITRLFHTHKIKLTFLPEMDCWPNTLSHFTLYFLQDWQVWFLWQLSSDPVKATSGRLAPLNGHGFVMMVCSKLGLHRELTNSVLGQFGVI